jgi:hypothetical protein
MYPSTGPVRLPLGRRSHVIPIVHTHQHQQHLGATSAGWVGAAGQYHLAVDSTSTSLLHLTLPPPAPALGYITQRRDVISPASTRRIGPSRVPSLSIQDARIQRSPIQTSGTTNSPGETEVTLPKCRYPVLASSLWRYLSR